MTEWFIGKYISLRLANPPDEMMDRLAYTLSHRRSLLEWRYAISASDLKELHNMISETEFNPSRASSNPRLGFVFTGQGAQWYAMGRELLQYPVFLKSMEESDHSLKSFGSQLSLLGEYTRRRRQFHSTETDDRGAVQRRAVFSGESTLH